MAAASNGPRLGVTDPILVAPPSALDTTLSNALESDLRQRGLYESNEEAVHREEARLASRLAVGCFGCRGEEQLTLLCPQVLGQLDTLVKDWVRRVSAAKGMTDPDVLAEVRRAP